MTKFKLANGYYLNKEEYSSVTIEKLWPKLVKYVNDNSLVSDNIQIDEVSKKIQITSLGSMVNPTIKMDLVEHTRLNKNVIRINQLNTAFDKTTRSLILSVSNVDDFPAYNTISYQTACENQEIDNLNSLFFHESSLVDYTDNFNEEDYTNCKHYIAIVTFKCIEKRSDSIEQKEFNDMIFVCYNAAKDNNEVPINKIISVNFNVLNKGTSINVNDFIESYNNRNLSSLSRQNPSPYSVTTNGITIRRSYVDFKIAVSMFKLIHDDEREFINFRGFNSMIYEKFIENLKNNLHEISFN